MNARLSYGLSAMLLLCCAVSAAEDKEQRYMGASVATIALLNHDLNQTSAFFANQVISPTLAKGVLGESFAQSAYMGAHPDAVALTPRSGPQGLDHIFIERDPQSGMLKVVTGESKADTSRLGMTLDGRQMSPKWTIRRLDGTGKRYLACADPSQVVATHQHMPIDCKFSIDVPLARDRHVHFFKIPERKGLLFTGTRQELETACKAAKQYGLILQDAAAGRISTERLLFHTDTRTNSLNIYRLGDDGKKKIGSSINLKDLRCAAAPADFRHILAKEIKKRCPELSEQNVRAQANLLARERSLKDFVTGKTGSVALKGAKFGSLHFLLQGVTSCIEDGDLRLGEFLKKENLATTALMTVGTTMDFAMPRPKAGNRIVTGNTVKAPRGTQATVHGKMHLRLGRVGATALLFAGYDIFQFWQGYSSERDLSANLVSGVSGLAAGSIASAGTLSLVAMYGTASTGTAIASLSGAAATNASLAYLGGGSLAAGGLGMAGGTIILSGGVAIVAIAVSYGAYKCVQWYYEKQDFENLGIMIRDTQKLPSLLIFDKH